MEQGTNNSKLSLFIAEFAGTAIFFVGIFFTVRYQTDPLTTAFGVGGGLFVAIMTFGKETGGHFNPAVSTGYYIFLVKGRRHYFKNYVILLLAQLFGGLFAGLLMYICTETEPTLLPEKDNMLGAFLDEIIFTFVFLLVIFCVKSRYTAGTKDVVLGALTVSMTLGFTVIYGGKISGGCYNPAVGIALNVWAALANSNIEYMQYLYLYTLAPLAGGLISGAVVKFYLNRRILDALTWENVKSSKESDVFEINEDLEGEKTAMDEGLIAAK